MRWVLIKEGRVIETCASQQDAFEANRGKSLEVASKRSYLDRPWLVVQEVSSTVLVVSRHVTKNIASEHLEIGLPTVSVILSSELKSLREKVKSQAHNDTW